MECAKEDYHFNLNAAIALTRLNHLDQAIEILFQQLHMLEHECDQAYFMGVNKQLGYIFYRKESYIDAVYYYMCGIDSSKAVPDIVYNYITTAMGALGEGDCPEFRQLAVNWYHRLFSRSMEAKRLSENKRPCGATAPALF
ncbi:hypothetical protein [Endozoicomonas atrinae]|uniref:hypothetical protein n=1 Tax=Endozoicomonas atrinae TaxID=1333660 RepID=UPI000825B02E|nr:hypothetical protein [Endozoicomonas atrinae]